MAKGTILLAAGGTGGHLFPAEALAHELISRGWTVHLATDDRAERYAGNFPAAAIHPIASSSIGSRNPFALVRAFWKIWRGVRQASEVIRRIKPAAVVGFGGYPTLPPIYAAVRRKVPTLIHEQNAVMGRANKALANRVDAIAGGFLAEGETGVAAKIVATGNPVRPAVLDAAKKPYVASQGDDPFRLLVFGGSQGAQFFSDVMPDALALLTDAQRARLVLTQQARAESVSAVRVGFNALNIKAETSPFFTDMAARIANAHLVISRSGASTVSEVAVIGRPALFVPYPHALDHDQAANAAALAASGGAEVHPQAALSPQRLAELIAAMMDDPERMEGMAAASRSAGRPDAARLLGDLTEAIASGKTIAEIRKGDARMKMPQTIGLVHFIGIGGIGMSGIAEVLRNLGYRVQGSDQADGANVQRLRDKGIECFVGHRAENIGNAEVVVVSTAIRKNNPELVAARERLLPIVRRAEMLAELMRFRQAVAIGGTHGKTTTTSMVAALLDAGGLDPTVINGGIINAYGTNARMGAGEWMVVEADESDGTFLKLPAEIAVVTNIDPEHLDHYGTFEHVREAFRQFVENVPFYGFGVMCTDHPEVQALVSRIEDRRVVTYGENAQADVRFSSHRMEGATSHFDVVIRDRKTGQDETIAGLSLPMPGRHNVSNATAAIAVAHELGIPAEAIRKGLSTFGGVKRRFTSTGTWNGVNIFDDYGHHPVEIMAVLKAARDSTRGRVIAIAQPHRFTRLRDLFDEFSACFNDADTVMVAPVYSAGEDPIDGVNSQALAQRIRSGGHRDARFIEGPAAIAPIVTEIAKPGDFVVFLGAGNITQWAYALPRDLGGESA